jgi:hypothetical protein
MNKCAMIHLAARLKCVMIEMTLLLQEAEMGVDVSWQAFDDAAGSVTVPGWSPTHEQILVCVYSEACVWPCLVIRGPTQKNPGEIPTPVCLDE